MNNELKLNVDELQDDVNHLKDKCDIDYKDEVQEITAPIIPLKNKKHVYVTFYLTTVTENGLYGLCMWHVIKHLQSKWVEKTYPGRAY